MERAQDFNLKKYNFDTFLCKRLHNYMSFDLFFYLPQKVIFVRFMR